MGRKDAREDGISAQYSARFGSLRARFDLFEIQNTESFIKTGIEGKKKNGPGPLFLDSRFAAGFILGSSRPGISIGGCPPMVGARRAVPLLLAEYAPRLSGATTSQTYYPTITRSPGGTQRGRFRINSTRSARPRASCGIEMKPRSCITRTSRNQRGIQGRLAQVISRAVSAVLFQVRMPLGHHALGYLEPSHEHEHDEVEVEQQALLEH